MKIKLIAPAKKAEWGESFWDLKTLCKLTKTKAGGVPLALPTLAALTPSDVEVKIVDENVEPINFDEDIDLAGISFLTSLAPRAYEIADEFRARNIPVVLGGIHASMLPEEAIQHADSVVIGEAEDIWPQLIRDFREKKLHKFYHASCFPDLKNSPLPRWDLLKNEAYSAFTVQTGRGCPYQCSFCCVTVFNGHKYRHKPIKNVIAEIKVLKQINSKKTIFFTDDNILAIPNYAKKLFQALIPLDIRWWCQASLNRLDNDALLELMYASGCRQVFVGFESISKTCIDNLNKGSVNRIEKYMDIVGKVHSHGIAICGSFILGSDSEEESIFQDTVDFIDKSKIAYAMINILTPLPGTSLYQRLQRENRLLNEEWSHYDGEFVCFRPLQRSITDLAIKRSEVIQRIYSYNSLYQRLCYLWERGVLIKNRNIRVRDITKGRIFFTITSIFALDIRSSYFLLKGLWDRRGTSVMAVLMAVNFHKYAYNPLNKPRYHQEHQQNTNSFQRSYPNPGPAQLISQAIRDLFLPFFPKKIAQRLIGKVDFAFLVHPLELADIFKKYPFLKAMPKGIPAFLTRHLWPVLVSSINGFRTNQGRLSKGLIIACPMTAKQMTINTNAAQKKVLKAVRIASKLGAEVIGLGAFTSIVTRGGTELVDKVNAGLTTGNAYAAALVIQNIEKIVGQLGIELKQMAIAIVGAAGSVGSACSIILTPKVKRAILIDKDIDVLGEIARKCKSLNNNLQISTKLTSLKQANIVVSISSSAEGIIRSEFLEPGTIVVDAAQPYNVHKDVLKRNDILVVNSGIARVKGISYEIDLGLREEEVYACLGEVLTLVWRNWKGNYNIGKVNPTLVEETLKVASEIGMYPTRLRNPAGPITEHDFRRIQRFICLPLE